MSEKERKALAARLLERVEMRFSVPSADGVEHAVPVDDIWLAAAALDPEAVRARLSD